MRTLRIPDVAAAVANREAEGARDMSYEWMEPARVSRQDPGLSIDPAAQTAIAPGGTAGLVPLIGRIIVLA